MFTAELALLPAAAFEIDQAATAIYRWYSEVSGFDLHATPAPLPVGVGECFRGKSDDVRRFINRRFSVKVVPLLSLRLVAKHSRLVIKVVVFFTCRL